MTGFIKTNRDLLVTCLTAIITGAWSSYAMLQWSWTWNSSLTGWNLVLSAMGLGYLLGFFTPVSLRPLLSPLWAAGWIPLWVYHPITGLLCMGSLMYGWALRLQQQSHHTFIYSSYATAIGFALGYLVLQPTNLSYLLIPAFALVLFLFPAQERYPTLIALGILALLSFPEKAPVFWMDRKWTPHGWVTLWDDTQNNRYIGYQRGTKMAVQARVDKNQPHSPQGYVRAAAQLLKGTTPRSPRHILDLGTGAGSFARWSQKAYPEAHITSVEAVPAMFQFRETYFPPTPTIDWVLSDARRFLQQRPADAPPYDWVYVDIFGFDTPPSHTITMEFWQLLAKHTHSESLVLLNVLPQTQWFPHLAVTFASVFPNTTFLPLSIEQGILGSGATLPKKPIPAKGKLLIDDRNAALQF